MIGVAQEKMRAFKAQKRSGPQGGVTFDFSRQSVAVNHYYFYVQDREWGPAFLKVGTYLPYPIKLCLNGHEWVKQQLRRAGVALRESRQRLSRLCGPGARCRPSAIALGPADVQAFFDRWAARLPWPLTAGRPRRRLHPSARAPATRGEPHAGLCAAGPGPALLRSRDPRESRPRAPRSRRPALSAAHHAAHAAAGLGLSHPRDHRRRGAQSARRVQDLARQAVLQGAARASDRNHDQQPEGLLRRQGGRRICRTCATSATRSIASSWRSSASATTAC